MSNPYQNILMDHYKYPRNRRSLAAPDFSGQQENVNCGDRVCFSGRICPKTDQFVELAFEGVGCVLSQAIASLVSEYLTNKPLALLAQLDEVAYLEGLIGTALGPTRLKCALLPLEALRAGVLLYHTQKGA